METTPLSVYLIDDNRVDCLIAQTLFQQVVPSSNIKIFNSPQEALSALKTATDTNTQLPHLILLDVAMPLMDGIDFLNNYKLIPLQKALVKPVIFLFTTFISPANAEKAKSITDVEGVLIKPLNPITIASILDKHFPLIDYSLALEYKIKEKSKLTIENWISEYRRLERKYMLLEDKDCPEAKGLIDHLEAVWSIISDMKNENRG